MKYNERIGFGEFGMSSRHDPLPSSRNWLANIRSNYIFHKQLTNCIFYKNDQLNIGMSSWARPRNWYENLFFFQK